jgi:hypothetical protein
MRHEEEEEIYICSSQDNSHEPTKTIAVDCDYLLLLQHCCIMCYVVEQ